MNPPALVWYAAYGSNLLAERFLAYLNGGSVPGSDAPQRGLVDRTPPRRWRRCRLHHRLVFAGRSTRWNAGVCFLDPHRRVDPPPTLGRAWMLAAHQVVGVWEQENRGLAPEVVDWERLRTVGHLDAKEGWYGRLLHLGRLEGRDLVTITCARLPEVNEPSEPYLEVVTRGLGESWGLSSAEAARYLADCVNTDEKVREVE